MLESLAAWFTPTSLFLLLNVVIATIYVTRTTTSHHKKHDQPPQQHHSPGHYHQSSPTLFDRVKSINFGLHNPDGNNHRYEHNYNDTTANPPPTHDGAPSLLARVKSVNFSDFQFSFFGSENQNRANPELEPVAEPNPVQEPETPALRSRLMARAPSLLKRVKSITFTDLPQISIFRPEPAIHEPESEPGRTTDRGDHKTHVRSKSEHKPEPRAAEKMTKSASEKMVVVTTKEAEDVKAVERRRPATARVERTVSVNGDVEVDAKADDFINKFKNQLKLQRLNSFVQYTDMITRGSSR